MSDEEKKNGNAKIAQLVSKAKGTFGQKEASEPQDPLDDSLELDVEDPTRPQDTPPTLSQEHDDLELEAEADEGGKKENFLGRMTMVQRVILVAVVGAVAFVGHRTINGGGSDLTYLAEGEPAQSQQASPASTPPEPAASPNPERSGSSEDGFEPIAQGNVAPDSNAIDLTPGSSEAEAENAFSLDPIDSGFDSGEASPADSDSGESSLGRADAEVAGTENSPSGDSQESANAQFDGSVSESGLAGDSAAASGEALGQMTLDGEFIEPPSPSGTGFGSAASAPSLASGEIEDIKTRLRELNSVVSSLSQSVVSIENDVSSSAQDDRALRREIQALMSALKERDQKVRSLEDRPELSDLVIFRAAANCSSCVPHALFRWNGNEVEVGDGLQWQGYSVAIRGDRLSLIKGDDEFHYWYR